MRRSAPVVVSLLAAAAGAQPVAVRGVAYDSVRGVPLSGAFVTLDGARTTTSDSSGRFTFDDVSRGAHTIGVQHVMLDSAGFSGIAARALVTDGAEPVVVATPSFETIWRARCGTEAPSDGESGIVFGTVTDVTGARPVGGASVTLAWSRLGANRERRIVQQRSHANTRSAPNGGYGVCDVPLDVGVRMQATTDSAASGLIDLLPGPLRVRRRDVRVAPATAAAGTVVGFATDTGGTPLRDARVTLDDRPEVRTDAAGRFTFRDVPAGTRQVEVSAVGMSPVVTVVDVEAGETVAVTARLRRLTTLDVVRVTASATRRRMIEALEARRTKGMGVVHDSTALVGVGTMGAALTEFAGVQLDRERGTSSSRFTITLPSLRPGQGRCPANILVDGVRMDDFDLAMLRPHEIAAIEVYARAFEVPLELAASNRECGLVAVWTKLRFK